jgi:hypothetical protein
MSDCKYCQSIPNEHILDIECGSYEDGQAAYMHIEICIDSLLLTDSYLSINAMTKINYCPMCGRRLCND